MNFSVFVISGSEVAKKSFIDHISICNHNLGGFDPIAEISGEGVKVTPSRRMGEFRPPSRIGLKDLYKFWEDQRLPFSMKLKCIVRRFVQFSPIPANPGTWQKTWEKQFMDSMENVSMSSQRKDTLWPKPSQNSTWKLPFERGESDISEIFYDLSAELWWHMWAQRI